MRNMGETQPNLKSEMMKQKDKMKQETEASKEVGGGYPKSQTLTDRAG